MGLVVGQSTWQYTKCFPENIALGRIAPNQSGYLICKSGGVGWVVAPASTTVSREWASYGDAVTTAQAAHACGDWFVPTCAQLQNPGYTCREYWESYCSTVYWSATQNDSFRAWGLNFSNGTLDGNTARNISYCIRAFRCVTY
tara:strand:- start:1356 stop:1784 length:429 start_codon:yes stop_codon:yes gene_type:complete